MKNEKHLFHLRHQTGNRPKVEAVAAQMIETKRSAASKD